MYATSMIKENEEMWDIENNFIHFDSIALLSRVYRIGNWNVIILSQTAACIVSSLVLCGVKKNGDDKRVVTRERRGTMVWHIALSSPRRCSDLTDLRVAISPRILISRLRSMSSFLRRTYHRAEFNETMIFPNEKYERFHKAPRRPQALQCYSTMLQPSISQRTSVKALRLLSSSFLFDTAYQVMHSSPCMAVSAQTYSVSIIGTELEKAST